MEYKIPLSDLLKLIDERLDLASIESLAANS